MNMKQKPLWHAKSTPMTQRQLFTTNRVSCRTGKPSSWSHSFFLGKAAQTSSYMTYADPRMVSAIVALYRMASLTPPFKWIGIPLSSWWRKTYCIKLMSCTATCSISILLPLSPPKLWYLPSGHRLTWPSFQLLVAQRASMVHLQLTLF